MDSDWEIEHSEKLLSLTWLDVLVYDIYESMDGSQSMLNVNMNSDDEPMRWITGFRTEVTREGERTHNNDFLCHTNVDFLARFILGTSIFRNEWHYTIHAKPQY